MRSGPKQKLKHGRRNTISLPLGGKCGGEQSSVIVPGLASAANQVPGFDRSVWGKHHLPEQSALESMPASARERSAPIQLNSKRMAARPGPPGRRDIGPKGLEFDPGRSFLPNQSPGQNHPTRACPARPNGAPEAAVAYDLQQRRITKAKLSAGCVWSPPSCDPGSRMRGSYGRSLTRVSTTAAARNR